VKGARRKEKVRVADWEVGRVISHLTLAPLVANGYRLQSSD